MENLETNVKLTEAEIQVLITIMSKEQESGLHRADIHAGMSTNADFTPLTTGLAIKSLEKGKMIVASTYKNGFSGEYEGWDLTTKGDDWMYAWALANKEDGRLKKTKADQDVPF